MRHAIFFRIINSVFWALLIVQAGCDVPSSSPAKHRDSLETEEDSLIPPLFTKWTVPGSIAQVRNVQAQFVKGNGFAADSDCAPVKITTRFQVGSVSKTTGATAIRRWQLILANRDTGGGTEAPIIGAAFRGTVVDFSDLCNQFK